MKLLLENWRKYLTEVKLSDGNLKLFAPFRIDDKFWDADLHSNYGVDNPEQLFGKIGHMFGNAIKYSHEDDWVFNFSQLVRDSGERVSNAYHGSPGWDALKNSILLWVIIAGYVLSDSAPNHDEEVSFLRRCIKDSGEEELKFYEGTAYRGMGVTKKWIFDQLFGHELHRRRSISGLSSTTDRRQDLGGKNYLNLYRLMRGEKVITPETESGYWHHIPRKRAESWGMDIDTAYAYALGGGIPSTMSRRVRDDSDGGDAEILAIIMVADAGANLNKEKFVDLRPIYKSTILEMEEGIGECVAFVKAHEGIYIKKAIIPHRAVKKVFDEIEKDPDSVFNGQAVVDAIKSGKLRPIKFENKKNKSMLKEGKYSELFKIEQDWEIIL